VVELSDAVAHPRTVVVHPQYALLAYPAVMNPLLLHQIAFKAVSDAIQRVNLISKC
jgi:hypothetical protein